MKLITLLLFLLFINLKVGYEARKREKSSKEDSSMKRMRVILRSLKQWSDEIKVAAIELDFLSTSY